jgi:hypothetical protein
VFVLPGRDEPVPCCVVDFLDLDRCQVVDGFVWPLVVEPVDTVHRLELGGRVPPEESPCRLQDLVSPTQLGTAGIRVLIADSGPQDHPRPVLDPRLYS